MFWTSANNLLFLFIFFCHQKQMSEDQKKNVLTIKRTTREENRWEITMLYKNGGLLPPAVSTNFTPKSNCNRKINYPGMWLCHNHKKFYYLIMLFSNLIRVIISTAPWHPISVPVSSFCTGDRGVLMSGCRMPDSVICDCPAGGNCRPGRPENPGGDPKLW